MTPDAVFKKPDPIETWRYIDFHVTNYSLGAIEALDPHTIPILDFARPFLEPLLLKAWLAERDLRDPWQEGNNIVNLGGFFLLMRRFGLDYAALSEIHPTLIYCAISGYGQTGPSSDLAA